VNTYAKRRDNVKNNNNKKKEAPLPIFSYSYPFLYSAGMSVQVRKVLRGPSGNKMPSVASHALLTYWK